MLLNDRLRQLFAGYDQEILAVAMEVLSIEQEHISSERPRVKDQIDEAVSRIAKRKVDSKEIESERS